jgi:hypothetical protein
MGQINAVSYPLTAILGVKNAESRLRPLSRLCPCEFCQTYINGQLVGLEHEYGHGGHGHRRGHRKFLKNPDPEIVSF